MRENFQQGSTGERKSSLNNCEEICKLDLELQIYIVYVFMYVCVYVWACERGGEEKRGRESTVSTVNNF